MTVLFDQGTPVPIRSYLTNHTVKTAYELGWDRLENGNLILEAEAQSYQVLLTTDRNLRYQLNLKDRKIGIVVLLSTSWPRIQKVIVKVVSAVDSSTPGSYIEIDI